MANMKAENDKRTMKVPGSLCGIFECGGCQFRASGDCVGCIEGNIKLLDDGKEPCGIYDCVTNQEIDSCDDCTKIPCPFYKESVEACPLQSHYADAPTWEGRITRHLARIGKKPIAKNRMPGTKLPEKTIMRSRWYLVALEEFAKRGLNTASSWEIAQRVGVKSALVRKDLSYFGELGTRNVGYNVHFLREKILSSLRLNRTKNIAWLGAGRLLEDSSLIAQLHQYSCCIVAIFDSDPAKLGTQIGNLQVLDLQNLPQVARNLKINAAVIALPDQDAQWAADKLVDIGVRAILNLTSRPLSVPEDVAMRCLDLSTELFALSYYGGESPEDEEAADKAKGSQSAGKVLIVDDDPDIAESMTMVLESKGYHVTWAANTAEGIEKLRVEKPGLVLLDIMMPEGAEGFQFIWKVRGSNHPQLRDIPILVISSVHSKTDMRFYPESSDGTYGPGEYLPVQGFIDKPIQPEDLIANVKKLIRV